MLNLLIALLSMLCPPPEAPPATPVPVPSVHTTAGPPAPHCTEDEVALTADDEAITVCLHIEGDGFRVIMP